jgi:outer membrane receptor protein involved in Fe transport
VEIIMSACPKAQAAGLSRLLLASLLSLVALTAWSVRPLAAQERIEVTGRITDASTGRPVHAANVHAGPIQAITDPQGRFRLADVAVGAEIHVERLGYAPVITTVSGGLLDVALEPSPVMLESMVVEAMGAAMLASNSSLAVTQVDRPELQATAGTSLAEALDGREGVSLSRVGAWGSRPSLRGLSGERIAVLIDGNRVTRACTFGMDMGLATIDPSTVERVEILTGPGSTAYGSGNVGGVINVVTRRPSSDRPLSGEVRASGSSAVPGGGLGASVTVAREQVAVSASVDGSSFGDYRTPLGEVSTSGYRQLTGDVKVDYEPSSSHRVTLTSQYYGARDIGWPTQGGATIPEESRLSLAADYGWQSGGDLLDGLSGRAFFQKLDHHMVMTMSSTGMGGVPMTMTTDGKSYSETSGGRFQARLSPGDRVELDVGTEVTRLFAEGTRWTERVMGAMAPVTETFHTWPGVEIVDVGAFVQGDAELLSSLSMTGGVRLDRVDRSADIGDEKLEWVTTGNLGLRAGLTSWLTARATVGIGYRTPDPMELYGLGLKPDGFVYRGRADLETEKSLSTELTLTAARGGLFASVTGFDNHLKEMITPVAAGDSLSGRPVREYRNLGEARLRGVSGTFESELPAALTVGVRSTWTHGEDPSNGSALPTIPPLEGGLTLRRDFGESLRWVEAEWQGAYRQSRVASAIGEIETPGYGVLGVRANARIAGSDLTLGVENVFDRLYRGHLDPYTLYRPGRNLFMRVSRAF